MSAEWQHGLCGCFDNCTICILSWFVPCYQFGKNAEVIGKDCLTYGLLFFGAGVIGVEPCFGAMIRGQIRELKGIPGGFLGDCCTWLWCSPCALAQESMELEGTVVTMGQPMGRV